MIQCVVCNRKFIPEHTNQQHCSSACILKTWDKLPKRQRTKAGARRLAKTIGLRSLGEVRFATHLDKTRVKYEYEPERIPWTPPERYYTPDFRIKKRKRGSGYMYIEYKGKFTGPDRTKILKVKAQHPDLDLRMIFERATNKLSRVSKTTYAMWCDKHGIPWAETEMPTDWRKE